MQKNLPMRAYTNGNARSGRAHFHRDPGRISDLASWTRIGDGNRSEIERETDVCGVAHAFRSRIRRSNATSYLSCESHPQKSPICLVRRIAAAHASSASITASSNFR